jgi:MYXO-CTERM domain-containing protein
MRQFVLASLILTALVADASANGRPAGTSTINFRQGHESDIVAGMTFGLVVSHDDGATWQWMCEKAVGYGGMYDPDYAYMASGALFATTFNGLTVNRDACNFDTTMLGALFTSSEEIGPDGALYVAMADTAHDHNIYKSTDDGVTFQPTSVGQLGDWWQSLKIAKSDAKHLYLFGYRFVSSPIPDGGMDKLVELFSSIDGGVTFNPLPQNLCSSQPGETPCTTLSFNNVSAIEVAGISKTDANLVFLRVTQQTGSIGDAIYRSTDGGMTWTKVLSKGDSLEAFAVRANGDLVAGTPSSGAFISHDNGDNWTPLTGAPHMGCLVENAAGELWGCTQNYGSQTIPGDGFGIMKTTDLVTWTPVLKYQEIAAPVTCAAGTQQQDVCQAMTWCPLETQLGITSTVLPCPSLVDAGLVVDPKAPAGCCDAGEVPPAGLVIAGLVGIVLLRRRRC